MEKSEFICPRCHAAASERFYGPCGACRTQLSLTMRKEAEDAPVAGYETDVYEPKMNVVPNQVATKE